MRRGRIRSTKTTGSSWTDSGTIPGAVALAVTVADPAHTFVAQPDAPGCAGVQVPRVDRSTATSCAATALPQEAGHIALSLVTGGGWLMVGETTMRSTDGLVTWRAS